MVWVQPGFESLVPLSVTASEFQTNQISPSPLSIEVIEELVRVVENIQRTYQGNHSDEDSTESSAPAG